MPAFQSSRSLSLLSAQAKPNETIPGLVRAGYLTASNKRRCRLWAAYAPESRIGQWPGAVS